MKILWITIKPFPEAEALLSGDNELKSSGGWMLGASNALLREPDVELCVASVSSKVNKLTILNGQQITYYIIPLGKGNIKYNGEYETYWKEVKQIVAPDIVHIHGTEFTHLLAYVNACGNDNVVVSIQGLKWVYERYYLGGMSYFDIWQNMTFHDIIKGSLYNLKKEFAQTGKCEIELIKKVNHVIGRTEWDKTHTWVQNPSANYYFCNETLREEFYTSEKWQYSKCNKHSIFLSQAYYPVKGLHKVIEAFPLVLRHYPDATLRVAGIDITRSDGLWGLLHLNGYGKYIKTLLSKNKLHDKVFFTGPLNAKDMKDEYLCSNLFICPSSIENSPNSLGEAQILGVPVLSSFVGGSMDMMQGFEHYLYRYEETEMLAKKICDIFSNEDKQTSMIGIASQRHDPSVNSRQLISIYKTIIGLNNHN